MAGWTIGWATLRNGPNRDGSPSVSNVNNGVMTVTGRLYPETGAGAAAAKAELDAFRQQWSGMPGTTVPVIADDEFAKTGMWVCLTSGTVDTQVTKGQSVIDYSGQFQQVRSFSRPLIEQRIITKLRPNSEGIVAAGIGNFVTWDNASFYTTLPETATLPTADGAPLTYAAQTAIESERTHLSRALPGSWNVGSARVEIDFGSGIGDDGWLPIHGRTLPPSATSLSQVRISDGNRRVSFFDGSSPGAVVVEIWSGSAWLSTSFDILENSGPFGLEPVQPMILRNDRSRATLRLFAEGGAIVDLSIIRGQAVVEGTVGRVVTGAAPAPAQALIVGASTGVAISGGLKAAANDVNGQRWWIAATYPSTVTTTPAEVITDGTNAADFAIGLTVDANVTTEVGRYFSATSITESVVAS